jgi:hypothetical protein
MELTEKVTGLCVISAIEVEKVKEIDAQKKKEQSNIYSQNIK